VKTTTALLEFAHGSVSLGEVSRAAAIRHLRDTLAVGIAGSTAPGAENVRNTMLLSGNSAQSRVLGTDVRLPAADAAFCNSFQIHCLEWDCVHEPAVVHALSVTTGALLAVADRHCSITEDAFLEALCIGVDIAAGLGLSSKSAMRFFRPATAGLIGAALACARLEKISLAQFADVLGLAYSQVSGTMQAHVEGSIALPLQIAVAARAAVTAVDLVKNGLTGPHDVLEGPFGFFNLIEPQHDLSDYLSRLGKHWLISDISTKPFPTGRAGHGTLSTLQQLSRNHALPAFASITAELPPLAYRLVARPMKPDMTPAYARLCLPFLGSLMLRDGDINPRLFTPDTFGDPHLQKIASCIHPVQTSNPDVNALTPQRVRIKLADGRELVEDIPHVRGSPQFPMTEEDVQRKFRTCLALAKTPLSVSQAALLHQNPLAFAISGKTP
jgi:2-methylcitrate dehydratase PrpD